MCRAGDGMQPRTAVVLFNALVRPVLEYCAVLWEGCIPDGLAREVEQIQSRYLWAISGIHKQGMGVSNDFLRAEHGVESACQAEGGVLEAPPDCRPTEGDARGPVAHR